MQAVPLGREARELFIRGEELDGEVAARGRAGRERGPRSEARDLRCAVVLHGRQPRANGAGQPSTRGSEGQRRAAHGGSGIMPPRSFYRTMGMSQRIGIDLGGTKIEALAMDHAGREVFRKRVLTPRGDY